MNADRSTFEGEPQSAWGRHLFRAELAAYVRDALGNEESACADRHLSLCSGCAWAAARAATLLRLEDELLTATVSHARLLEPFPGGVLQGYTAHRTIAWQASLEPLGEVKLHVASFAVELVGVRLRARIGSFERHCVLSDTAAGDCVTAAVDFGPIGRSPFRSGLLFILADSDQWDAP